MTLRLDDKWIWDFWFAQDGPTYHVFYLQAPRSLKKEKLRHWHVSIGHAVSDDLQTWQVLPDALAPNPLPAWDDKSTWTGSIIQHNGVWYLFYTGTSLADEGFIQRVGLATSTDLLTWQRYASSPLIEADGRYYEQLDRTLWHDQAWRDPYVIKHPTDGNFYAYITARANTGPADGRAVIALARSGDLLNWEVLPPVTSSGEFGQMEVPQLVEIEGRYYLLFCTSADMYAEARRIRPGVQKVTGTHYLVADNPLGPFHYTDTQKFLVGDEIGSLYAGKMIQGPTGQWLFLAWRYFNAEGEFVGELSDPYPVTVDIYKNLVVNCR